MDIITKLKQLYSRPSTHFWIGISIILFFTISYIVLMLNKYWQFEYFAVDNVYFDTALWKMAHFQAPIVAHPVLGKTNIFGDHFHPVIFLISILYIFTSKQEIVFIAMGVLYGLSAVLAMLIGFKLIKSRFVTYALLTAYFLYIGTQNALIYGFHEINFVPLFFFFLVYTIIFEKWRLYWLALALLLLTKESMMFLTIPLSFFMFFAYPKKRTLAVVTSVISCIYYLFITHYVIPHLSASGGFLYGSDIDYPNNIAHFFHLMTTPPEKVETFVVSVLTFGLLPLLNPLTLPLVLQDFVVRYIIAIPGNVQYTLFFHYNLGLAPLLLFSSIWSIHTFQTNKYLNATQKLLPVFGIIVLLFSFYFYRFYGKRGPLLLVFNKAFYQTTTNNSFLWKLVKKTPQDGSVMTQNHLEYIFAHQGVFPLTSDSKLLKKEDPKYIVVDLRQGQNPNNYFPIDEAQTKELIQTLLEKKVYSIYFQEGTMYILKKSSS